MNADEWADYCAAGYREKEKIEAGYLTSNQYV